MKSKNDKRYNICKEPESMKGKDNSNEKSYCEDEETGSDCLCCVPLCCCCCS